MRRCLGRGGWLIVWRGEMAGRSGCAPFLSARVRRRCRWFLVFRSPRLASRLFCSSRRGGRCVACLASVGRGGCGCDVASSRPSVPCGRPVLLGVSCRRYPVVPFLSAHVLASFRLFSPLLLLSSCSSRRACRMASSRGGVAVWCGDMRCGAAVRGDGRFGDAVSCGVVCRERDEGRDAWRDEGCTVFVSSSWRFVGRLRHRG